LSKNKEEIINSKPVEDFEEKEDNNLINNKNYGGQLYAN
jgi:hypothetical protein